MRSAISAIHNAVQMLRADADKPGVIDLADLLSEAAETGQRTANGESEHRDRVALRNALASLSLTRKR